MRQYWVAVAGVFCFVHVVRKAVETVVRLVSCDVSIFTMADTLVYQVVLYDIINLNEIGFRLPVGAEDNNRLGLDFLGNLLSDILEHRIYSVLLIVHHIWLISEVRFSISGRKAGI